MEGLFDNLEGRSDSQNFEPLTSTLRFSPCRNVDSLFLVLIFKKTRVEIIPDLRFPIWARPGAQKNFCKGEFGWDFVVIKLLKIICQI